MKNLWVWDHRGKVLYWGLLIGWILYLLWLYPMKNIYTGNRLFQGEVSESVNIYKGHGTSQSFFCHEKESNTISIFVNNSNDTRNGKFSIKLLNDKGEIIERWERDKFELSGGWIELKTKKHSILPEILYSIEVEAESLSETNAILLGIGDVKDSGFKTMEYSGEERAGKALAMSVYQAYPNLYGFGALAVFFITVIFWWLNRDDDMRKLSLGLLLGTGLCMVLLLSPFSANDEAYHYYSSLKLSNVILGHQDVGRIEAEYVNEEGFPYYINANTGFLRTMQDAGGEKRIPLDIEANLSGLRIAISALEHPVEYLPQAMIISIGRVLRFNMVQVFFGGRIASLLFYILLMTVGICIMPGNRDLLLLVGLLPMSLQQGVSYSYDILLNGISIILIAYIVRLIDEKRKIQWKTVCVLTILGCLLAPVKLVYFVLLFCIFLIPCNQYYGKLDYVVKQGTVLVVSFLNLCLTRLTVIIGAMTEQASATTYYTPRFAFEHPKEFIRVLFRTMEGNLFDEIKRGFGQYLAGAHCDGNIAVSEYIIFGFFVLIAICSFNQRDGRNNNVEFSTWQRLIVLFVVFAGIALVYYGLMPGTPYGMATITGVQGRYFIPFFVPILLCVNTPKIQIDFDRKKILYAYWFLFAGVIVNAASQIW